MVLVMRFNCHGKPEAEFWECVEGRECARARRVALGDCRGIVRMASAKSGMFVGLGMGC